MWNAVIKTKLTYALHTIVLPQNMERKLNAFQMRGIRKILRRDSTYINRENTNQQLIKEANAILGGTDKHSKVELIVFASRIPPRLSVRQAWFSDAFRKKASPKSRAYYGPKGSKMFEKSKKRVPNQWITMGQGGPKMIENNVSSNSRFRSHPGARFEWCLGSKVISKSRFRSPLGPDLNGVWGPK